MKKIAALTIFACLGIVFSSARAETTVWQIGTRDGDVNPIEGASEYPAGAYPDDYPGLYIDTIDYIVGTDADPIGAPSLPGLLGEQAIGYTVDDGRPYHDTARVINIHFNLPCGSTGLTLWYGRYGSETNLIKLNGETKATITVPNNEGQGSFTEHQVALGSAKIGDNVITIEYADGGHDNGHYIDYLKLTTEICGCQSVELCAGQSIPIGEVLIANDGVNLYVNFVTDEVLLETHVHVASDLGEIPQTKKGNPIPGQFEYSNYYPEDHEYIIPLTWDPGMPLYIAAHAATGAEDSMQFESNIGDVVYGPLYSNPGLGGDWGIQGSAVHAYNWLGYNRDLSDPDQIPGCTTNPYASLIWSWGWGLNPTYEPDISGILWISTAPNTELWAVDSWRKFVETFEVPGYPISGSITVNADNEYSVFLNDDTTAIGSDDNIWDSLLTHSFYPIEGQNKLEFIVENWYQGSPTSPCDQLANPNGLTYAGVIEYYVDGETAWGDGCDGESFTGSNWATYFTYTVQDCQ